MRSKIKRCVRIKENTSLEEYTGFIFVSNKILKYNNPDKLVKLNITKFFTKNNSNNFFLENKYLDKNINLFLYNKFGLEKENILENDVIYKKNNKIIYLIYLNFNTKFEKSYSFINMYTIKKLEQRKDLYYCIYKNSKLNVKKYKILFDKDNYLSIDLKYIYYYLIGNTYSNIDLNKYIDI
jgi:hypothetical protein